MVSNIISMNVTAERLGFFNENMAYNDINCNHGFRIGREASYPYYRQVVNYTDGNIAWTPILFGDWYPNNVDFRPYLEEIVSMANLYISGFSFTGEPKPQIYFNYENPLNEPLVYSLFENKPCCHEELIDIHLNEYVEKKLMMNIVNFVDNTGGIAYTGDTGYVVRRYKTTRIKIKRGC